MTRPARVLWLAKGLGRGGAEQLLAGAARHFDPDRFEVEVAYLLPWKDHLVADFTARGIPVHCLGQRNRWDPRWLLRLRRLVAAGGFDLVHTHMPLPAVGARVGLASPRPVLVHTEHNVWERYHRLTYLANAVTYRRNDAVLAVSNSVARSVRMPFGLRRRPLPPMEVLYHGIEPRPQVDSAVARRTARERLDLSDGDVVIGTVGNLTPKKDQETLIRALAQLPQRHRATRLVIVGDGPLRGHLAQFARDLLPAGRVIFTGSRDDVQELLYGFDVFALTSRHEGLSIALVEAMSAAVPCVATRVGGVPEVITDGQEGFLVPAGDPAAVDVALSKLLDDPQLRQTMGQAGVMKSRHFAIDAAAGRIAARYDELLAGRR